MSLFEDAKKAADLVKQASGLEGKDEILRVVRGAEEVLEQKIQLERENRILKEKLKFKGNLEFRNNVLWSRDTSDPGPFCNACWEGEEKAVHLTQRTSIPHMYDCPKCKSRYNTSKPGASRHPNWPGPEMV